MELSDWTVFFDGRPVDLVSALFDNVKYNNVKVKNMVEGF